MRKGAKRWLGALAILSGAAGTAMLFWRRSRTTTEDDKTSRAGEGNRRREVDRWARPGMSVTFRAQLMPGRNRTERTFRVRELLPSSRVVLEGFAGEHTETEFEPVR